MTNSDSNGFEQAKSHDAEQSAVPRARRKSRSRNAGVTAKISVGEVMVDSMGMYLRNFVLFTCIAILCFSPLFILQLTVKEGLPPLLEFLLNMLLQLLVTAAIISGVFRRLKNQRPDIGSCLAVALQHLLPLIGVMMVVALACAGISIIPMIIAGAIVTATGGGIAFLVIWAACIPALWVYIVFYVAPPCVVVENVGVGAALSRSKVLTRGNRFRIFGIYLSIMMLSLISVFIVGLILGAAGDQFGGDSLLVVGIDMVSTLVFGAFNAVVSIMVYYKLKVNVEGADAEELASVFD